MKKSLFLPLLLSFPAALWACGGGMDCGMHGGGSALRTPVYLLLLGFGYWLLRFAEKETNKNLKYVGRMVSAVILVTSLFGLLCPALFHCASAPGGAAACPFEKPKASGCPFMGQSTVAPTQAPQTDQKK